MTDAAAAPEVETLDLGDHPPAPKLCLRVGVSGHRKLQPEHEPKIRDTVSALLGAIEAAAKAQLETHAQVFAKSACELRFITAAAAGSDTIAGEAALGAGWALDCPLPFSRADYARDFEDADALERHQALLDSPGARVFAIDGKRASDAEAGDAAERDKLDKAEQDRAYETVGLFMLHRSDLLICVWDPDHDPSGRGGTYEILRAAYSAGLPALWLRPGHEGAHLLWLTEDAPTDVRDATRSAQEATDERIGEVVDWIVAPPASGAGAQLERFLERERQPKQRYLWTGFSLLEHLSGRRKLDDVVAVGRTREFGRRVHAEWKTLFFEPAEPISRADPALDEAIRTVLLRRYIWADELAIHFAHVYRSAYVYAFVLGACAVFCALLGIFEWFRGIKWVLVSLEIVILASIGFLVVRGDRLGWHRRFLQYRELAELLRPWRLLAHVGGVTPALRTPPSGLAGARPPAHRRNDPAIASDEQWVGWYLRASVRETPMPAGEATAERVDVVRRLLRAVEINGQIRYQTRARRRHHAVESRLELVGLAAFGATGLLCAGYLIVHFGSAALFPDAEAHVGALEHLLSNIVTFFTALLPAIGSATLGISVQGEFRAAARRAHAMAQRLKHLRKRIRNHDKPSFSAIARYAEMSADIMAEEVSDWAFVYRAKPLTLPG